MPVENSPACPVCGNIHDPCANPDCGRPTLCHVDTPGEPFDYCHVCILMERMHNGAVSANDLDPTVNNDAYHADTPGTIYCNNDPCEAPATHVLLLPDSDITAHFCTVCKDAFEWGQSRPDAELFPLEGPGSDELAELEEMFLELQEEYDAELETRKPAELSPRPGEWRITDAGIVDHVLDPACRTLLFHIADVNEDHAFIVPFFDTATDDEPSLGVQDKYTTWMPLQDLEEM